MPAVQPILFTLLLLQVAGALAARMHVPPGLLEQVPAADLQMLKSGKSEFPVLYQQDRSGLKYGAIVLLHGYGKHLDWESELRPLRHQLPDFGWDTLSISLPESPPGLPPERGMKTGQPAAAGDDAPPAAEQDADSPPSGTEPADTGAGPGTYAKQVSARLDAALEFLKARDQKVFVLVGQNEGAVWALRDFTRRTAGEVAAAVFLNAHNRAGGTPLTLPEMLAALGEAKEERPLLDLLLPQGDAQQRKEATRRVSSVHRQHLMYYRQQAVLTDSRNMQDSPFRGEDQITRVIRGWLLRHRSLLPSNE